MCLLCLVESKSRKATHRVHSMIFSQHIMPLPSAVQDFLDLSLDPDLDDLDNGYQADTR
jgi:hypothetical protein